MEKTNPVRHRAGTSAPILARGGGRRRRPADQQCSFAADACAGIVICIGAAAIRAGAGRCAGAGASGRLEAGPGPAQSRADAFVCRPSAEEGGDSLNTGRIRIRSAADAEGSRITSDGGCAGESPPSRPLLPSLVPADKTIAVPPRMFVCRSYYIRIKGCAAGGPKIRMKFEKDTPTTETDDGT